MDHAQHVGSVSPAAPIPTSRTLEMDLNVSRLDPRVVIKTQALDYACHPLEYACPKRAPK
jgi:hypothetical protein